MHRTRDSTGIAIGHVARFELVNDELRPRVIVDAVLRIDPPVGGEIDWGRIVSLLTNLRSNGLPIRTVTSDQFGGVLLQRLGQVGFTVGQTSVDQRQIPMTTCGI